MSVVSPEALADVLLKQPYINVKQEGVLFLEEATVVVFDGLVIWKGNLNMALAIPRLLAMAQGLGLPLAVIEKEVFKNKKSKRRKSGKHCGPATWMKSSWTSIDGLDYGLKEQYDENGQERPTQLPLTNRKTGCSVAAGRCGMAIPGGRVAKGDIDHPYTDDDYMWFGRM